MLQRFHLAIKPVEKSAEPGHPLEAIARWVSPHRRQHRIKREAHEQRDHHGHHHRDAKLVEEQTNDAAHERDWRKYGNNRKRGRQHGEADFFGRL